MAKTREIKKRIKAVGNIKRITRTMQMIATAKFSASQHRALAGKPYTKAVFDIIGELAQSEDARAHPLFNPDRPGQELTLVLTSDRGLCGPYNGSVLRTALAHLRADPDAMSGLIELVGKKGVAFFKFNGIPVARHYTEFGDKPEFEQVARLASDYVSRFLAGEVRRVRVVFMRYVSAGRQAPEIMQLLPLRPPENAAGAAGPRINYEFSPEGPELLDALLPAAVNALLFQAFNDAIVSEHVARMVAMKAATDNAGKMGKALTRRFNRARQAQITTELTEIISGAAALE